jgi:hypothetical protein
MALDLKLAADMFVDGVALKRAWFCRADLHASEQEIDARVVSWLRDREDAPNGDADGVRIAWPRR